MYLYDMGCPVIEVSSFKGTQQSRCFPPVICKLKHQVSKTLYFLKKKKLHGLSPRANYTDRAIAACRRSDCQLFVDRGCLVVSVRDPYGRILSFLDRSRCFSIK
jgi:hypothetical protein